MTATLERPSDQRITARLAGAGSLRDELAALFEMAPPDATSGDFRRLILDENAAGKRSGTARMWAWKRLKLRYALDSTETLEFTAFRRAYAGAKSASERGLVIGLMLARTDRLFRDVTLEFISPHLASVQEAVDPAAVAADVDDRRRSLGLTWSTESIRSVTNHLVSSWRDAGFIASGRGVTTTLVKPGPIVAAFAAALGKAEGLTDRAVLRSVWFDLLGADEARATELLREAAAVGLLTFKFQADVVEIHLGERARGTA
jgi:Putative inner membrane protein (DUF1819).